MMIAKQSAPFSLLTAAILLIIFSAEMGFPAAPIIISHSDKSQIMENRGRWSISPQDTLYDLAGDWQVIKSSLDISGTINLPFVWYDEMGFIHLQKSFRLPVDGDRRSWKLVVDGVSLEIRVMINGVNIESRRGNNLSFQMDLGSRTLRFGEDNKITIVIDNTYKSNIPPLRGSIYSPMIYGGIYRGIYLVSSPFIRLNDLTVKRIENNEKNEVMVELLTEVQRFSTNDDLANGSTHDYFLDISILSETEGEILSGRIDQLSLDKQGIYHKSFRFALPSLNSVITISETTPYRAVLSLHDNSKFHEMSANFNLMKQPEIDDEVRCINYVFSSPTEGPLVSAQRLSVDAHLIVETGANTVKISQGMQNPHFLSECERLGLNVFLELPVFQVPNGILTDAAFIRSCLDQMISMIDRDGRYSCVAGWGIGGGIEPPNKNNIQFYKQLTDLIHQIDHRPVFAVTTRMGMPNFSPLDFIILDRIALDDIKFVEKISDSQAHRVIIGNITHLIYPGNFKGLADPTSEIYQAHHLRQALTQIENASWCRGAVVGDLLDWRGSIPTISGPLKGTSNIYTSGILTSSRQPRPAHRVLMNHWKLAKSEPLTQGSYTNSDGSILVVIGLILIVILIVTVRQNNIFRFNIQRTFSSPSGFFQDIKDHRYFQTGHTLMLAIFISSSLGLTITGWVHAHRSTFAIDWITGYLFRSGNVIEWVASIFWNPLRSFLFFSVLSLFWLGILIIHFLITGVARRRKCSLTQSIDFSVWSSVIIVGLLPIGLVSARLFRYNLGWLVVSSLIILLVWAQIRFIYVYANFFRLKPVAAVLWWSLPSFTIILAATLVLNHFNVIFTYWSFIMENIIR